MIPFLDLNAQHQSLGAELATAIQGVLDRAEFVLGGEVAAFEEEFAACCGAQFGVAVNSGTSALHLALLAAGVGPGDEVITAPFSFVATVAAIGYTGARARFVDIDAQSLTLDAAQLEAAVTVRTRAILPVHLFGQPADMDPIVTVARRHGVAVIEDAAQAHCAEYKGRRAGSLGEMGCFSFYPTKNLGACGEGGMLVTNNPGYAHSARLLRNWGEDSKYHHILKGYNYRMDGLQGAILRVKLRRLEAWNEARRAHAALYERLLAASEVQTPPTMNYGRHVYHVYSIRSARRDALRNALSAAGVETRIHYPTPLHLLPAWSDLGYRPGDFPVAERASRELLSLPIYPELATCQIEQVAEAVRRS